MNNTDFKYQTNSRVGAIRPKVGFQSNYIEEFLNKINNSNTECFEVSE